MFARPAGMAGYGSRGARRNAGSGVAAPFWLRLAPHATVALFLIPIAAGLAGTALPAFGWLPAAGGAKFGIAPWVTLFRQPGFAHAVGLTLWTGFAATLLSLILVFGFCAVLHGRPLGRPFRGLMTPVLAAPHAAVAIGVGFLLAPSGWLVRLLSPWLTGWSMPPDIATVQDPFGIALIIGLLLKEVPYLLLMTLTALGQVPAARHLEMAAALGYDRTSGWFKLVLPQIYPQIRLPVYAVLAYALSVVDVALILGPDNPPTLSVLAFDWFTAPDVRLYFPAAAAALLLLAIMVCSILLWRAGEIGLARAGRAWIARGRRRTLLAPLARLASGAVALLAILGGLALLDLVFWSFTARWRFPDALPTAWTGQNWGRLTGTLAWPLRTTLIVALAATAVAVVLALVSLENEQRGAARATTRSLWLLYVPLLVPQIAFLFGGQVLLVDLHLDSTLAAVIWAHLLFVLPYVFLSLSDSWRALDFRYVRTALCLGASPGRVFFRVKLPILLRPVLVAAAVGFAVSIDQYLPTVFAGSGRIETLTTEAVTLASGGDRRVVGVYAFLQAALPLIAYLAAIGLPALLYVNRRDLGGRR